MSQNDISSAVMFDQAQPESRTTAWMSRAIVTIAFLFFGFDKFSAGWDQFFHDLHFPHWFRPFTALTEIAGALLVLFPRTTQLGLFLLSATMASAALIWIFPMHAPANCIFPGIILIALLVFWQTQRAK